jgi:heterodisulfide reductase subunit B
MMLQPLRDVPDLGVQMILKRKIGLLPKFVRPPRHVQRVETDGGEATNTIAYYPGCSLDSTATEYDHTFRAVCEALDLELIEPPGWVCCGSSPAHSTDPVLAGYYSVLNLSLIERMGLEQVVAPCLGCYQRFRAGAQEVAHDADLAAEVADRIGYEYQGTVETFHAVGALLERVGIDAIHARVRKPLKGLKVASYYGCATTRPPKYTGSDSPENPTIMEEIVRALGAEPVDWSYKTDCCGGSLGITQTSLALELSAKIIESARDSGADIMINACPLCQVNVENRQVQMDLGFEMPCLYITQLMALAFGLEESKAELDKNMIDPRPVLQERRILT